jgi:hypothetical protein
MELQNKVQINVFGYTDGEETDDKGFFPRYISEQDYSEKLNVLVIGNDFTQHYVLITDISGFLSSVTKHNGALHYCLRCFHG